MNESQKIELFRETIGYFKKNNELAFYPFFSFILVSLFFAPVVWLNHSSPDTLKNLGVAGILALFIFLYLFPFFIKTFFQSALIFAVFEKINGRNINFSESLRNSLMAIKNIFFWSLVLATVDIFMDIIVGRTGTLSKIVRFFLDITWGLLTYFVLPLLIIEKKGISESFAYSADLIKANGREVLVENFSIFRYLLPFALLGVIFFAMIYYFENNIFFIVLTYFYFAAFFIFSSVFSDILRVILYNYAVNKKETDDFNSDLIKAAFVKKESVAQI